jgi:hypothetical protein
MFLFIGVSRKDDLAKLEWISHFLEDKLSEFSLSYTTGKLKIESRATNWSEPVHLNHLMFLNLDHSSFLQEISQSGEETRRVPRCNLSLSLIKMRIVK